jgi:hypothetical protein
MGAVVGENDGLLMIDGLDLVPLYDIPIEILYSQGITIDWSGAGGKRDAGLYGAYNGANYHAELWRFSPAGPPAVYVGDIGPKQPSGRSVHEVGDVAVRPRKIRKLATPQPR